MTPPLKQSRCLETESYAAVLKYKGAERRARVGLYTSGAKSMVDKYKSEEQVVVVIFNHTKMSHLTSETV